MENLDLPAFPGPQIAGPARPDAPFVAAGRRALATGWAAGGVEDIWIYPHRALRRLRVDGAAAAHSARMTPAGFERRLEVDGREVLERVFVPATEPSVVIEWELLPPVSSSAACFEPLDLDLEWECDLARVDRVTHVTGHEAAGVETAAPLHGELAPRRIMVERLPADGPVSGAVAAFSANREIAGAVEPLRPVRGRSSPGLRCRAGVRLVPGERFRLAVHTAADASTLADARSVADTQVLVAARVADGQRRAMERVTVSATDPLAGQALRWAALRLPSYLAELGGAAASVAAGYAPGAPPRPSAGAALRVGLASLALGDTTLALAAAQSVLDDAEAAGPGSVAEVPAGWSASRVAPATAAVLLYAQHLLGTGNPEEVGGHWSRLLSLARALSATAADTPPQTAALVASALIQLALAAESLGQAADAADLRRAAAPLAPPEATAAALAEAGGWGGWSHGGTAAAYLGWRTLAESGLGPARAAWPGPAGIDDASAAARVVSGIIHGMLGVEADAPRGRLRLRPQMPEEWDRATVQHLRVGDAEVSFSWVAAEGVHRFEVEQLAGAVPLRLVFEPAVTGTLGGVRVDGVTASLGWRPWGERTLVPVQLVLDSRRRVEIATSRPERTR